MLIYILTAILSSLHFLGTTAEYVQIADYPFSAFLWVSCIARGDRRSQWSCGSSIIDKAVLLTAAHCLHTCLPSSDVIAGVGKEHRIKAYKHRASKFLVHEKYDEVSSTNDIAIVRLDTHLTLSGNRIRKVYISLETPKNLYAYVIGWGVNTVNYDNSRRLKAVKQTVFTKENCDNIMGGIPEGSLCAGNTDDKIGDQADSGSPLVVKKPNSKDFNQIGIVSYKIPKISKSVVVYTDVAYFYKWIHRKAIVTKTERLKKYRVQDEKSIDVTTPFEDLTLKGKTSKGSQGSQNTCRLS